MGLRPIHLIGLMAWAVVTWDRTLFVEATDQENKNVSSALDSPLPPGIVVPLPYVYPEYTDPREPTTPPTTQDNRATKTSVSDVILQDVTNTMLESMSMDEVMQIVDANGNDPVKSVIGENRYNSSVSGNNNESTINKPLISSQSKVEEMKRRPSEKRPNRFGTRIKTSTLSPDVKNETKTVSNEKPYRSRSSSIRVASRNMPANSTSNDDDISTRKRPVSKVRKVVTRRRRPNVRRPVKVKNTESAGELENANTEAASKTV